MPEENSADNAPAVNRETAEEVAHRLDVSKKDLARQLWERLAKSRPGPDNKDLMYLARFVPLLANGAIKTLLTRKPGLEELKELIQHVPKAREGAVQLAIQNFGESLSEDDLRFLLVNTRSPEVAKFLLQKYPSDLNLIQVENNVDGMTEYVEQIRHQELTRDVMREIDRRL
ncbi:MAG: hypothetical protein KDA91_22075 [Planctomycetaceae bacterium]|nr:hypothetical protein [Planctomycetaceae bacterium]